MKTQSITKRTINLLASIIVTGLLIVVWYFIIGQYRTFAASVKFISYGILLYGMTWILDAVFLLAEGSGSDKTHGGRTHGSGKGKGLDLLKAGEGEPLTLRLQFRRALAGMILYLLYSALVHAVAAVLFDGGKAELMIRSGSMEKCALAFIGYCLFLQNALHRDGKRVWSFLSGILTFALGIILALVLDLRIVSVILAVITMLFFLYDANSTYKELNLSPKTFIRRQIGFLALISVVMIFRFLTPVHFGGRVGQFVISALINLLIAVIIDVVLLVIMRKRDKKDQEQGTLDSKAS